MNFPVFFSDNRLLYRIGCLPKIAHRILNAFFIIYIIFQIWLVTINAFSHIYKNEIA